MPNPNDYRMTVRLEQDNVHRWLRELLADHSTPGAVAHDNSWPDLEVQDWYEPSRVALFSYAKAAGECGVRHSINAGQFPTDIQAFLHKSERRSTHDVWFVPTDPNAVVIKKRGREVRALIVTRHTVIVARLGCSHPDFVVEQLTPTYSVHRCVACELTYDRDTGD